MRMFVAVVPPPAVVEELCRFVEPRHDEAWCWMRPDTWHVTLAFLADVEPFRYEPLVERLATVAAEAKPFELKLDGVGCFPNAADARVLYAGVSDPAEALPPLAARCRTAATTSGIEVPRERFRPHLTLARVNRGKDASRWLRALVLLESQPWLVSEFALVESFLPGPGHGVRHEVRETFFLGS